MLSSLFGDLGGGKDARKAAAEGADQGFAATAILESVATEVNDRGQMIDRHQQDLVVTGSPAQAIREHFATTRADMETASRLITLLDPVGVWGSAVVKALSDAGGRPIERMHLREQSTLRTLATISRTTLARRHEETLKIYHADVRAPGPENAEIPVALMERSHMTTVIVGPMQPHAVDALLGALQAASSLPTWRCPHLLFMLPPAGGWIHQKIDAVTWPPRLHVHTLTEPLISSSSVWNAMLGTWNQVKGAAQWEPATPSPELGNEFPIKVADLSPPASPSRPARPPQRNLQDFVDTVSGIDAPEPRAPARTAAPAPSNAQRTQPVGPAALNPVHARAVMTEMLSIDGLLGCAVVDGSTGLVLAREVREDGDIDIDLSAAAAAQVLRAHRMASRSVGLPDRIDEVMSSSGSRQQVLRTVARHPDLFLMVLLDKHRANLALARFKLMDVERHLL